MYQSYDSGKLTSTILNLDIEELSFCFASAILTHIQFGLMEEYNLKKREDEFL
jgi:hypothetical protein